MNTTNEYIDNIEALARLNERIAAATTLAEVRRASASHELRSVVGPMRPNAQHKALRQSGLFRPRTERDKRRQQRHPKHRNREAA